MELEPTREAMAGVTWVGETAEKLSTTLGRRWIAHQGRICGPLFRAQCSWLTRAEPGGSTLEPASVGAGVIGERAVAASALNAPDAVRFPGEASAACSLAAGKLVCLVVGHP